MQSINVFTTSYAESFNLYFSSPFFNVDPFHAVNFLLPLIAAN